MTQVTPPPRRTERRSLMVLVALIVVFAGVFLAVRSCDTSPEKLPSGQAPGSSAPENQETPEGAKPPAQRESN